MTDLSKVVPSGSTLISFLAEYINPRGEIVASAIALTNGNFHAFCRPLAITEQMPQGRSTRRRSRLTGVAVATESSKDDSASWPLNVFSGEDAAAQLSIVRAIASRDLHNLVFRADYRIVPALPANSGTRHAI